MAADVTDLAKPVSVTLGTSGNATAITLPSFARRCWVSVRGTNPARWYSTGTDGGAINANAFELPAGLMSEVPIPKRSGIDTRRTIYIAGTANSVVVDVVCN